MCHVDYFSQIAYSAFLRFPKSNLTFCCPLCALRHLFLPTISCFRTCPIVFFASTVTFLIFPVRTYSSLNPWYPPFLLFLPFTSIFRAASPSAGHTPPYFIIINRNVSYDFCFITNTVYGLFSALLFGVNYDLVIMMIDERCQFLLGSSLLNGLMVIQLFYRSNVWSGWVFWRITYAGERMWLHYKGTSSFLLHTFFFKFKEEQLSHNVLNPKPCGFCIFRLYFRF